MPEPRSGRARALARGRAPGLGVAAVLGVAFVAAFAPVLAGERSFFHYDLFTEHVPVWHAVQGALLRGEAPFWIDGQYGGNPLLYTQEAPLFYPLTVPFLLTGAPAHRLADLFSLLHFLLAGALSARLVREETGDPVAAAAGGLAWMLSTRTLQCALWPNAVAVAGLVPGLLLGLLRIGRGERRSGLVLSGLFGGLIGLSARPQAAVGFLPLIAAVAGLALVRAARRGTALKDLALSVLVAFAISAPSVVPTALLHPELERSGGLTERQRNEAALTIATLPRLLQPGLRQTETPEVESYPGVAVIGLSVAAFVLGRGRRDLVAALALSGAAGLAFSFGDAGPYRLLTGLPVLDSLRAPSRFLLSFALALALAGGLGLAALRRWLHRQRWLGPTAVVLLAVDLVVNARAVAPTAPEACYRAVPELARLLSDRPPDAAGFPRRHWSAGTRLPDARAPGLSEDEFAREAGLPGALGMRFGLEGLGGGGPALARTRQLLTRGLPAAAPLAAVDRVVVPGAVHVVPDPLPRAFAVPEAVVAPGPLAPGVLLSPRFDPRRSVLLEPPEVPAAGGWEPGRASVRLVERHPGRVRLDVVVPGPGYVVLLDSYEEGWRATVDGAEVRILPANVAFRAIPVGAGRHTVDLRYRARGIGSGLALCGLGLLLLLVSVRRLPASTSPP